MSDDAIKQAVEAERARIVALLRDIARKTAPSSAFQAATLEVIADNLESGKL